MSSSITVTFCLPDLKTVEKNITTAWEIPQQIQKVSKSPRRYKKLLHLHLYYTRTVERQIHYFSFRNIILLICQYLIKVRKSLKQKNLFLIIVRSTHSQETRQKLLEREIRDRDIYIFTIH